MLEYRLRILFIGMHMGAGRKRIFHTVMCIAALWRSTFESKLWAFMMRSGLKLQSDSKVRFSYECKDNYVRSVHIKHQQNSVLHSDIFRPGWKKSTVVRGVLPSHVSPHIVFPQKHFCIILDWTRR